MSRTYRNPRLGAPGRLRDGALQHHSSGCRHHGACGYCASNRTHASRRRTPLDQPREAG